MRYFIDKNDPTPAYLQLYRQLRNDITEGLYPYNSKLPSKRTIAADTDVSTVTVEHSYALLCEEGYIESKERSGYFVAFHSGEGFMATVTPRASVRYSEAAAAPSAEPSASSQPEFPFSVLAKTMRSVMNDYETGILDRCPGEGSTELREALRRYLSRSRGILADTDQIIIGSGSEYLYRLIVELFGRDYVYAIESPSYKKIELVYRNAAVRYEMLPLGPEGINSDALAESAADILHISPYRSFPSGVTASASKRHEYIRWASKGTRYIIEDDFESEFTVSKKPEETLFSNTANDNVIYMNTFSKTISPSLRIGYMVLPKHLVQPFRERLGLYSCTVPTFMQYVLAKLLDNGDFERHINRVRRKKRKELL